jgi:hypothetical protein
MSMKLVLEIVCDNAAFGLDCDDVVSGDCRLEVARILHEAANKLEGRYDESIYDERSLHDSNGNRVGSYRLGTTKESGL